jgi:hypothetical protein
MVRKEEGQSTRWLMTIKEVEKKADDHNAEIRKEQDLETEEYK